MFYIKITATERLQMSQVEQVLVEKKLISIQEQSGLIMITTASSIFTLANI